MTAKPSEAGTAEATAYARKLTIQVGDARILEPAGVIVRRPGQPRVPAGRSD